MDPEAPGGQEVSQVSQAGDLPDQVKKRDRAFGMNVKPPQTVLVCFPKKLVGELSAPKAQVALHGHCAESRVVMEIEPSSRQRAWGAFSAVLAGTRTSRSLK
jgi:hypothetical protein